MRKRPGPGGSRLRSRSGACPKAPRRIPPRAMAWPCRQLAGGSTVYASQQRRIFVTTGGRVKPKRPHVRPGGRLPSSSRNLGIRRPIVFFAVSRYPGFDLRYPGFYEMHSSRL